MRIPPTMEKFGLDKENALKYIREMDEQRVRWARYTYGRDIRDPLLYDFQFNLGHISQKVLCGIMQNLMSELELQASIEAALVCDERTRKLEIKAHYEIDKVNLVGPYLEENELTIVKEIVRETVQVEEIEYTPGYTSTIDIDGWQQFMLPGTII